MNPIDDPALFYPKFFKKYADRHSDEDGIGTLLYNTFMKTDSDIRRELLNKVVLSGGNMMCAGMKERLWKEMWSKIDPSIKLNRFIQKETDGAWSSWKGGIMLAGLSTFNELTIKKEEYEEVGPSIVTKKCF